MMPVKIQQTWKMILSRQVQDILDLEVNGTPYDSGSEVWRIAPFPLLPQASVITVTSGGHLSKNPGFTRNPSLAPPSFSLFSKQFILRGRAPPARHLESAFTRACREPGVGNLTNWSPRRV